jgi:hypothetical protein
MKNFAAGVIGAVGALGILGAAAVVAAPVAMTGPADPGFRHEVRGEPHDGLRHGVGPGMMFGRICGPGRTKEVAERLDAFEAFAKFEGEQKAAWDDLRKALATADGEMDDVCAEARDMRGANSADKLTHLQQALSKSAALVATVEAPYSRFYGTLDEKQKEVLDDLVRFPGPKRP